MKFLTGLLAASLSASPLFAQETLAQDSYVLAKKDVTLPLKQKFRAIRLMTMNDAQVKIELGSQQIEGLVTHSNIEEILYDFVSENEIRVHFEKNRSLEKSVMRGQESKNERVSPAEGKLVILTQKAGKWAGKLAEGEVPEAEREAFDQALTSLIDEFNGGNEAKLYGTEPRKIGESWEVDPALMPGMNFFDIKGGKLKITFAEITKFQGEQCAVLNMAFSIKAEMRQEGMQGMGTLIEGSSRVVRSLERLADYQFTGKMRMNMAGETEVQPGLSAKMLMQGDMKIEMGMTKLGAPDEKAE